MICFLHWGAQFLLIERVNHSAKLYTSTFITFPDRAEGLKTNHKKFCSDKYPQTYEIVCCSVTHNDLTWSKRMRILWDKPLLDKIFCKVYNHERIVPIELVALLPVFC